MPKQQPLYLTVKNSIIDQILSSQLKPDDRILPEDKLTEEFNVSKITISRAFAELMDEGWVKRIPRKGSFVNTDIGHLINKNKNPEQNNDPQPNKHMDKTVGMTIPVLSDYHGINLVRGIQDALHKKGYYLYIEICDNDPVREEFALKKFKNIGVCGLLVIPSEQELYNKELLEFHTRQKYAYVDDVHAYALSAAGRAERDTRRKKFRAGR